MEDPELPQSGDVIFVGRPDIGTLASGLAQMAIDPDARRPRRLFGHAAVVVSPLVALEAYPAADELDGHSFELPHSVTRGQWTHAELRAGVRLIPIADIAIPAMKGGADLRVLRSADPPYTSGPPLTPGHQVVLTALGSQYSLGALTKAKGLAAKLGPAVARKLAWTSVPNDLATRLGINDDLRKRVEAMMPEFMLPDAARTFFCSELVVVCLRAAKLLPDDAGTERITPTGLDHLLTNRGWTDVSSLYQCQPDTDTYLHMTPLGHSASYTETLAITELGTKQLALILQVEFLKASLDAFGRKLQ